MRCSDARDAMLTAEREDLRAEGDGALAAHLGACAACRAAANHIDATTAALASIVAVRAEAPGRRWSPARLAGIAALPIAAGVIGVLMMRDAPEKRSAPQTPLQATAQASRGVVSVDVARGQTAAVIKTRDPNVTIVWLAPGGGL
jgi:hypothetical protein